MELNEKSETERQKTSNPLPHTPRYLEIRVLREILTYFALNQNENTTYQNLCDTIKVVLRGKFTALTSLAGKQDLILISQLSFYLRKQKEKQIKYRVSIKSEIIRIRAEIKLKASK